MMLGKRSALHIKRKKKKMKKSWGEKSPRLESGA